MVNCFNEGRIRIVNLCELLLNPLTNEELLSLQKFIGFTVTSKYVYDSQSFKLRVTHPDFDIVENGSLIPHYNIIMTRDDKGVQFEWIKYE